MVFPWLATRWSSGCAGVAGYPRVMYQVKSEWTWNFGCRGKYYWRLNLIYFERCQAVWLLRREKEDLSSSWKEVRHGVFAADRHRYATYLVVKKIMAGWQTLLVPWYLRLLLWRKLEMRFEKYQVCMENNICPRGHVVMVWRLKWLTLLVRW